MSKRKQLPEGRKASIEDFITKKQSKNFTPLAKKNSEAKSFHASFRLSKNDHNSSSFCKLIELKCIISQQLPKMPREYIVKLLFDGRHESLLAQIPQSGDVLGGICFRCFEGQDFVEIVFLAVESKYRDRRIGTQLIDRLKQTMQQRGKKLLLTYADNTALGFFRKQGFQAAIETPGCSWNGYIKTYLEGTLMECKIFDGLKYTRFKSFLQEQSKALITKVRSIPDFEYRSEVLEPIKAKYSENDFGMIERVPGVLGGRWSVAEESKLQEQPEYSIILQQLRAIEVLRKFPESNLFRGLVQFPTIKCPNLLQTWSSLQRRIINGRNFKNVSSVCEAINKMLQSYGVCIEAGSREANIVKQFKQKIPSVLTALMERRLTIHIDPIYKEKEGRARNSSKQKSFKKN